MVFRYPDIDHAHDSELIALLRNVLQYVGCQILPKDVPYPGIRRLHCFVVIGPTIIWNREGNQILLHFQSEASADGLTYHSFNLFHRSRVLFGFMVVSEQMKD